MHLGCNKPRINTPMLRTPTTLAPVLPRKSGDIHPRFVMPTKAYAYSASKGSCRGGSLELPDQLANDG